MKIEHVGTYQKLASKHPIVVLKSGLKNNWMKKLDHVNRPLWKQLLECYKERTNENALISDKG